MKLRRKKKVRLSDNHYVARLCPKKALKNGYLRAMALELRKGEKEFSFNNLIFFNRKNRSIKWLVRRLLQTQTLGYDKGDFLIVIQVKELRKIAGTVVKYDPQPDTLNHVLVYSSIFSLITTNKIGKRIINYLNLNPDKYIYSVDEFRCTHALGCPYSGKMK